MQQALDGAYGELPDGYRAILERTVQSNDELQRLAETLLLVSRYESGERSTRREPVELVALARGVVEELEPLWRSKKIAASVASEGEAFVSADPGEMRRALVNLVANAVNFTPGGGSVNGDRTNLSVEDTGFGVPEPERARLFERLGAGSGRPGAGSGLGLYIVRRIAESHDGAVAYEPRPEGGSIFTLRLPALAARVPA
jgi:signal transduction histidine kinase